MENAMVQIMLKRHIAAIFLAVAIGVLYAGPYIYHAHTPGYRGVFMADSGDADFYLTAIHKSAESKGLVGDPFLAEYKEARNPFQYFLIEFLMGKMGELFGLSIASLATTMSFIFPALLTLLLYAFTYELSGGRRTALFVSLAMLVGTELIHPDGFSNLLHTFRFDGSYREFLMYARPVNPQISALFFFATLWSFFRLSKVSDRWSARIIAGTLFGFLAYIYPYFWLFVAVVFGLLLLRSLLYRNRHEIRSIVITGATAVVVMLPFLISNFFVMLHGSESALTQAIPTHRFMLEKILLVPLLLYLLVISLAKQTKGQGSWGVWAGSFLNRYRFIALLLLAGFVVINQQVLTGRMMFPQHFHFFTNIPIAVLALALILMELIGRVRSSFSWSATVAISLVIFWHALGVQVGSYRAHAAESLRYQALAPIFAELNRRASGTVVLSDYYLSTRLTMYTNDFSYSGGYDATFAIPQSRLMHDYFVTLALRGVKEKDVRVYIEERSHREEIGGLLFIGTYWRDLCGSYGCFPDTILNNVATGYEEFLKEPLYKRLNEHRIDYILWDKDADPQWRLEGVVLEPPVLISESFALYGVRH